MAEVIVVGIDNSRSVPPYSNIFKSQCEAVKFYCQAKFEANPDTIVGLFEMSSFNSGHLLYPPTGSLQEIVDKFSRINTGAGELDLIDTLLVGRLPLAKPLESGYRKKRMVLFVGGLTNLSGRLVKEFGPGFRDQGIAVDVIYFYQGKTPKHGDTMFEYRWGWSELEAFVNTCNGNDNDNSHIVRVGPNSSIRDVLFKSILKKTPSKKENANGKRKVGDESRAGN